MRIMWLGWLCALLPAVAGCAGAPRQTDDGDVVARSIHASIQLFTEREDDRRRAGSAVALATHPADGRTLILTTAHLIEPPVEQRVFATTPVSRERVSARILAVDAEADLAVLEAAGLPVQPAALQGEARLGDGIWVVSYPWGRRLTVVDGVVSQIHWPAPDAGVLPIVGPVDMIDAPVTYGSSGGGVFDDGTGRLIGIVRGYRTAKLAVPGSDSTSLEVPIGGETTVISAPHILCFLKTIESDWPMPAALRAQIAGSRC